MTAHLNHDRFLKVLALAESPIDGEALAAIRKASAMARTAGLSLREAVSAHTGGGGEGEALGWVTGYESGLQAGRMMFFEKGKKEGMAIARAESKITIDELKKRQSKNQHYERGVIDGRNAERADADVRVAAALTTTEQDAFKAGYSKVQNDAQPAINSAYGRGFKDGQAGVDFSKVGTARGGRGR